MEQTYAGGITESGPTMRPTFPDELSMKAVGRQPEMQRFVEQLGHATGIADNLRELLDAVITRHEERIGSVVGPDVPTQDVRETTVGSLHFGDPSTKLGSACAQGLQQLEQTFREIERLAFRLDGLTTRVEL